MAPKTTKKSSDAFFSVVFLYSIMSFEEGCRAAFERNASFVRHHFTPGWFALRDDVEEIGIVHWAARGGDIEILKLLLCTFDGDVNSLDGQGWTPLHWAVRDHQLQACEFLLDVAKARVNEQDHAQRSPLYVAVDFGHQDLVWPLIDRGADKLCVDEFLPVVPPDVRKMFRQRAAAQDAARVVYGVLKMRKGSWNGLDRHLATFISKSVWALRSEVEWQRVSERSKIFLGGAGMMTSGSWIM